MQLSAIIASLGRFLAELQRRKVLRIAAAYVVGAWIVLQVALALQTAMSLSGQFSAAILALLVIGFFVTLVLSWFYEITPEGVKRTAPATGDAPLVKPHTTDLALAGALALVVIVALVQLFTSGPTAPPATPATATAEATPAKPEPPALGDKSIAVLPFANLSPDRENEYFADGLTEELLNLLAKIPDLKVISRTSSFAFKGKDTSIPEIARQLGVRHVLEGSVRAVGGDLRVTAQLIDVVTDTHLWTETFERKIENVFVLQDELARAIATALNIEMAVSTAGELAPTKNLDSYRLYLQGREYFRVRSASAIEQGIILLKQATALDPAFAEAYAMLAASYYARADFAAKLTPVERYELETVAREMANAAIARKPNLGLPRAILSALHRRALDWEAAIAEGEKAVRDDPSESSALLQLGLAYLTVGKVETAAERLAAARRVDPYYDHVRLWSVVCELSRGNEQSALALAEALSRSPTQYGRVAHFHLATNAYDNGDGAAAERHFRAWVGTSAQRPFLDVIVRALHNPAAKPDAVRATLDADAGPIEGRPRWLEYYLSLLGEHRLLVTLALRHLDSKRNERLAAILTAAWQPRFAPMRHDPKFKLLMRRVGLVDFWKKHGWPDRCRAKGEDDFECS